MRVLLCVVAAAAALQLRSDAEANPIRRIVKLLQKMQTEVQEEGKREEELFEKFECYCKQGASKLTGEIEAAMDKVKQLQADIEAKTARKAQLDQEVSEHKKDRDEAKAAVEKATNIRQKEKADYEKNAGDSKQNIDALNRAVDVLGRGMGKAAFLQQTHQVEKLKRAVASVANVADAEKDEVLTFLTQSPYGDYQASSGEIVGILKEMKDEMDRDLGGIVKEEEDAVKAYEALMAAKKEQIASATAGIEKKTVRSGELAVEITEDKNEVENTKGELSADQEFIMNMATQCKTKKGEYEKRVADRNAELGAISEAIKVLNDDDALDIFKKTLPSPGQSFIQKLSNARDTRRIRALAYIQSAGVTAGERAPQIGLLTFMLRVGKVDFSKVLKMIDDMVANLDKEQKDDDEQLNYCNAELDSKADAKKDTERAIGDLSTEMDELAERVKQAEADIENLNANVKSTKDTMAEATEQRQKENAAFQQSSTELTAAMQLITKAKNRLMKYYNPALYKPPPQRELTEEERIAQNMGEVIPTEAPKMIAGTNIAVNLLTKKPAAAPETWEGDRKNKGSQSGGITALMDMLTRDLETQMQDAEHDEKTAQRDYETVMADGKASIAKDSASLTATTEAKATADTRKNEASNERKLKNEELAAVNKNIADLHGSCDFLVSNFDFRKVARTQERESLKNAKAVLSGANFS